MSEANFTLILPIPVVDATLTSMNVAEAVISAYNAGTTYGSGTQVGVTAGTVQSIYQSLQVSNTGHTPSSSPTWWQYMGVTYTAYDVGTTYALGDIVSSIGSNIHLLYKSTTAGNVGQALTNTTKWTLLGSTNARAMFDDTYGSQTTNTDSIVFTTTPGVLVNSMWFGNLDVASIRVQQADSGFDTTINLNTHNVLNWYDWYYMPLTRLGDLALVGDIPPYPASAITVTMSNVGSHAKCGIFVMGVAQVLGLTQWEIIAGILSYSGTTTDGFGNTKFLPRAKAKKLNLEVRITPGYEDEAFRIMTACTDVPLVLIGTTKYQMAQAYGSLGSWALPITNKGKNMTVEFKGLT